ncbi:hypothetical protein VE01_10809 [Pseudogymnoascus verrucosus]|uniref:Uncharacterized protein n=1 Tax=Pseudogymnoascus verrucosus TaxID=342668 RepID=A0A2P6FGY5_9PEZI|nr:uncharacterized protein VE01_10809 [Pseudogymnoascus verrucosus]PQM43913.1 hypothetical protein VE01_10809 [Pseudogymnoascus verrucosus]
MFGIASIAGLRRAKTTKVFDLVEICGNISIAVTTTIMSSIKSNLSYENGRVDLISEVSFDSLCKGLGISSSVDRLQEIGGEGMHRASEPDLQILSTSRILYFAVFCY